MMTDSQLDGAAKRKVLIVGARGVVGTAAVEQFAVAGWAVVAISRRRPDAGSVEYQHIALDLTDASACRDTAEQLQDVTHVVYAALFEKPGLAAGWVAQDQMQTNLGMMQNLLGPLCKRATGLRHVSMLQGTKAYGAHIHPMALPGREDRPRDPHENFYWLQEDYVRAAQVGTGWNFTIWRPQIVFGGAINVAMNLMPVLGAYAAICRELNLPFSCPVRQSGLYEAVDANLLARGFIWAAGSPAARDQIFNIANGDVFVWENVWPAIAKAAGLPLADAEPRALSTFLLGHAATWDAIVKKYDLRPTTIQSLVGESHHYADILFNFGLPKPPPPALVSTVKLRQAGFSECMDTEMMLGFWLNHLAERKVIPNPAAI